MKKISLKVDKRMVLGKKVKKLRREGFIPATIYGKDIKSISVQASTKEFEKVYKEAGETGLVELSLNSDPSTGSGQGKTRPVFIKNLQLDPKLSFPLHADFYQVNLTEKIKTMVPVEPIGEAKAVLDKVGLLEIPLAEVELESLPTDVPEKITVDVSHLAAIGDQLKVADIKVSSGVAVLSDPEQILFKIGELVTKEAEEQAKAEEAAASAAAAPAEGVVPAEGEAPTEGEKPAEAPVAEVKPEEKKE